MANARKKYELLIKSNMYVNGVKLDSDDNLIIPAESQILIANHERNDGPLNFATLLEIIDKDTCMPKIKTQELKLGDDAVRIYDPLIGRSTKYIPHIEPFQVQLKNREEFNILSAKKIRKIWFGEDNIRAGLTERFGPAGEYYSNLIFQR